jgi:hypothetical protein
VAKDSQPHLKGNGAAPPYCYPVGMPLARDCMTGERRRRCGGLRTRREGGAVRIL